MDTKPDNTKMEKRPSQETRYRKFLQLIDEAGTQAELFRRTGVAETYITAIKKGRRQIEQVIADKLEHGMEKVPGWMDKDDDNPVSVGERVERKLPIILWTQAGRLGEAMLNVSVDSDAWVVHPDASIDQRAFALRVQGDSMVNSSGIPSFPDGCIIVVDPSFAGVPGDHVVVRLPAVEEAVFGKLEMFNGKLHLKPLNSHYPVTPMPDDAQIIGVVVSVQNHQAIVPRSRR